MLSFPHHTTFYLQIQPSERLFYGLFVLVNCTTAALWKLLPKQTMLARNLEIQRWNNLHNCYHVHSWMSRHVHEKKKKNRGRRFPWLERFERSDKVRVRLLIELKRCMFKFATSGLVNQGAVNFPLSLKARCNAIFLLFRSCAWLGFECIKHNSNEVLNHCRIMFS